LIGTIGGVGFDRSRSRASRGLRRCLERFARDDARADSTVGFVVITLMFVATFVLL